MTDVWAAIATTAAVLFGMWRMLAHYEARNDAAHDALSRRLDMLRGELNAGIDKLFELLSSPPRM